jgi:hypothetical protein
VKVAELTLPPAAPESPELLLRYSDKSGRGSSDAIAYFLGPEQGKMPVVRAENLIAAIGCALRTVPMRDGATRRG